MGCVAIGSYAAMLEYRLFSCAVTCRVVCGEYPATCYAEAAAAAATVLLPMLQVLLLVMVLLRVPLSRLAWL